jgi:signal transduction histidine kinase/ActR/RegA family two-component response regulator
MGKLRALHLSLSTKVLVPVLSIMVLMLAVTAWTVNQRITRQFETEAARSLATADAVFRNSQKTHTRNVLLRYRNLNKEPRYKAAFQSGDLPTLRAQIRDLPEDQGVDVALFSSTNGEVLAAAKRDLLLVPLAEFQQKTAVAIRLALGNEANADTIRAADQLFDVVSIPVLGPDDAEVIGAITFGSEIGEADFEEFSALTQSKIVVLAGGQVIASTVPREQQHPDFAELFRQRAAGGSQSESTGPLREIKLGDEHYFCSAGTFTSLSGDNNLGYLLLCSYEQPLRALHTTQQMLLLVCGLCILAGTGVVWFLVGKLTEPLRALRDSAEAVGRGDFSQRVEVASGDECGELAEVFNRMTGNIKQSREQLERTVETLRTTQAQLIQSEKLSGIGEFVAGVAHELNNPLTTVMGFSELLAQSSPDPQHRRHLDMILKSAQRCQKIVQNLLSFARRHQPERKLSSVNELVTGAVEFLQYQLRTSNIEVVTKLAPSLPKAMLDPHQMQQVFLNIINNARQAIEGQRPKGRIRITTEACGHNVRVEFQDNGPGIPEANLSKVFDPFFTTKEIGKGTGLGLSLCYGIVKEHHGSITVSSRPGEGATFVIELPLARDAAQTEEAPGPTAAPASAATEGAGRRVLVIDDEDAILEMVQEMLGVRGYQVDVARDGESALRRIEQSRYDLALCDWKMPGLNGRQVYERLRVSNPVLAERMIFVTGDVVSDTTQAFLEERKKVCLTKPFSLDEFRAAVSRALTAA